jgi:hypothetical protein
MQSSVGGVGVKATLIKDILSQNDFPSMGGGGLRNDGDSCIHESNISSI